MNGLHESVHFHKILALPKIIMYHYVLYYLKHEQQCFIRYKDTWLIRSDKTRTANVLNCFKNDRASEFIDEVIFKKYVV
jgi:hypothetical protein